MTQTALFDLLERYRAAARTEREKGEYFENLVKAYLENDDVHKEFFSKVQTYAEWAERRGENRTDTGIDLVATRKDAPGYCAIQCKFYAKDYAIQKKDIDSFFTASGKESFTRRIIVCSSIAEWSPNAENALSNQSVQTSVIRISDMAQSRIDWTAYGAVGAVTMQGKKTLRPHQKTALQKVKEGFEKAERGKLIMACGTGKTFTSLRIAEDIAGKGGFVLYLVPSLSLMAQTVREWTNDADLPQASFAVCSDVHVGKRKSNDDSVEITVHDLEYPATTCADKLAQKTAAIEDGDKMRVIFATYHSIQVIADAQKLHGMADFNLVICDEAHRTTGVTLADEDESNFVRIHKQEHIRAHKRLYMTATPRLFADKVKKAAKDENVELCSMDDAQKFGETFHTVSFSYAVENGLLTDYRVIVLAVDEGVVSRSIQKRLTGENAELNLDDATKIIGCYRALAKLDIKPSPSGNHDPMRRAVAFCKSIKASKLIKREFSEVVNEYNDHIDESLRVHCEVDHVDGTFNATSRNALLQWLSDDAPNDVCRILSNAKCLSEGVDVPALDAILFLHPRKSQVDVVQSVGRVMRLAPGKEMGYVILPVGIPAGVTAEQALQSNEKYKVVWQILNALRAHDDRFNATINQADLKEDISDKIEVVAVAEHMPQRRGKQGGDIGGGMAPGDEDDRPSKPVQQKIEFTFDEFQQAIMAKIVKKCGTREYWEDWAKDIADIAQKHITRIHAAINADSNAKQDFERFLEEIRDDLNESVSESEAVEMLAQHMITKPVFEALFKDYSFSGHNPVSKAMQDIVAKLEAQRIDNENNTLKKFYDSVRRRVKDIKSDTAKQQLIVQLYDRFFKNAFPQMTQKLGIVYTPVEVVDFIIRSVEAVLKNTFGASLGSKGVHILDPFTGTGTFITRLLQSRIIPHDMLEYKYKNELHANEIVLLAYYIAAINIESAYHGLQGGDYAPFPGICLTDTFQLYEKDDLVSDIFEDNSQRRIRQKKLKDIRVIMGNPPYSVGQGSANDNAANVKYANLDGKIRDSYAKYSTATNKNALYDSYIRAIKWASDRIGDCGVVAYISGSAWIERNFADGLRKCLADEYSDLYIFHLRGDARKNMLSKGAAKEGGNIFGQNSMTGAAISVLVKNPDAKSHGNIHFCNIGEDLKTNEKLAKIVAYDSIEGITRKGDWQNIIPDAYNDWLGQRDSSFDEFIEMGNKKDKSAVTVVFRWFSDPRQCYKNECCRGF